MATFTQSSISVCQGNNISYNATGSTFEDTLLWVFPGGSPSYSNSVTPTVLYNTPGTYVSKLYVIGGGCSDLDSAEVSITILANPAVSIAASSSVICPGVSTTLTASGGSVSYVWSPPTALSATTGASVIANPTSTITYNVLGTGSNGCMTNSTITIDVDQPPVAAVTVSDSTICIGQTISFDGSLSTNVTSFAWSFPGGTPSSSTSSSPVITYATPGSFTATLTVSNTCGADSSFSQNVSAGCVGIDESNNGNISSYFNMDNSYLNILVANNLNKENLTIIIFDAQGKVVLKRNMSANDMEKQISLAEINSGLYILHLEGNQTNYNKRFVKP